MNVITNKTKNMFLKKHFIHLRITLAHKANHAVASEKQSDFFLKEIHNLKLVFFLPLNEPEFSHFPNPWCRNFLNENILSLKSSVGKSLYWK